MAEPLPSYIGDQSYFGYHGVYFFFFKQKYGDAHDFDIMRYGYYVETSHAYFGY